MLKTLKNNQESLSSKEIVDKKLPSVAEIQFWIAAYIADLIDVEPDEIDIDASFDAYSLDSSIAIGLTGDLENWLQEKLDPTLLYDYPTIKILAQHLASDLKA